VPVDEDIEVDRVEILARRIREPGNVSLCNCSLHPGCERRPLLSRPLTPLTTCDSQ